MRGTFWIVRKSISNNPRERWGKFLPANRAHVNIYGSNANWVAQVLDWLSSRHLSYEGLDLVFKPVLQDWAARFLKDYNKFDVLRPILQSIFLSWSDTEESLTKLPLGFLNQLCNFFINSIWSIWICSSVISLFIPFDRFEFVAFNAGLFYILNY